MELLVVLRKYDPEHVARLEEIVGQKAISVDDVAKGTDVLFHLSDQDSSEGLADKLRQLEFVESVTVNDVA